MPQFLGGLQGWPVHQPAHRIHGPQMKVLREVLVDAGTNPTTAHFPDFFASRDPA